MKIGVVSDTHSREIPAQLFQGLENVDLIVHAGDFCSLGDYKKFTAFKDVKAVYGNMDESGLRKELPGTDIFEIEEVTIGLYHGDGSPHKILDSIREKFSGKKVDAIIFGHSHKPFNETIDNVLYFNPGSPNDPVVAPYASYGILEVEEGKIKGKIIKIGKENG